MVTVTLEGHDVWVGSVLYEYHSSCIMSQLTTATCTVQLAICTLFLFSQFKINESIKTRYLYSLGTIKVSLHFSPTLNAPNHYGLHFRSCYFDKHFTECTYTH